MGELYTKFKYSSGHKNILTFSFLHSKDNTKMRIPEEEQNGGFVDLSNFHAANTLNSYSLDLKHFMRLETYYKNLDNIQIYDNGYSTKGEGFAYGAEFFLQKKKTPSGRYDAWLTYAYAVTKRNANDGRGWYYAQQDEPNILNLVYNYKFSKKFSVGLKGKMHSGRPYTPVVGREETPGGTGEFSPIFGTSNSKRFPLYHKLDVRLAWLASEKKNSKTTMALDLFNIYQYKNVYDYYWNKDFSEKKTVYDEPLLPVMFSVETEF